MPKDTTLQLRASTEQRKIWKDSAASQVLDESKWVRDALDAWVLVCGRAGELDLNPRALLDSALEDYIRIRAAIAEVTELPGLSESQRSQLLRVLAPAEWVRRETE